VRYLVFFLFLLNAYYSPGQVRDVEQVDELDTASYLWLKKVRINPYITAELERASLLDNQASNLALSWGVLVNDRFSAGTFISVMTSDIGFPLIFPNGFDLDLVHGGLHLSYLWPVTKSLSAGVDSRFGFGEMEISYAESGTDVFSTRFTSVNPSIVVDYQVGRFVKLTAGLGYRLLNGYDFNTDELADLDGTTMRFGLKLGLFKRLKWPRVEEGTGDEE